MVKDLFFRKIKTKVKSVERCSASAYYTSQWGVGGWLWLGYRWAHFLLLAGILVSSLLSREEGLPGRWGIFLTNWALGLYLAQAALALRLLQIASSAERKGEPVKISENHLEVYGALHSTSLVIAIGVTVIYWSFVYDPKIHQLDLVNIAVHGLNSAIMVLDFFLVAHPMKMKNIYLPPLFTLIYSTFNVIYFLCGGTNRRGNHYVYKVLDWNTPISAALFILGGMFLLVIVFFITWFLAVLRRRISIRLKRTSHDMVPQEEPVSDLPLA